MCISDTQHAANSLTALACKLYMTDSQIMTIHKFVIKGANAAFLAPCLHGAEICTLVRNCVNGSAPIYLQEICNSVTADVHRLRLRSADHDGNLVVSHANTDRISQCGFSVSRLNQWNKLPPHIRKVSDKPEQFARALKTFLFPNSTDKHF